MCCALGKILWQCRKVSAVRTCICSERGPCNPEKTVVCDRQAELKEASRGDQEITALAQRMYHQKGKSAVITLLGCMLLYLAVQRLHHLTPTGLVFVTYLHICGGRVEACNMMLMLYGTIML